MYNSFATPWAIARQAPVSMGFPRQGILEWVVISSPRGSSWPRDWTVSLALAGKGDSLPLSHQGSPEVTLAVVIRYAGEAEWLRSAHSKEGSPSTQQPGKVCSPSKPPPYSLGLITSSVPVLLCWREGLLVLAFTCFR